jgi:hypothetical protein
MIRDLRRRWLHAQAERRLWRKVPSWRYEPRISVERDIEMVISALNKLPRVEHIAMSPASMRALMR